MYEVSQLADAHTCAHHERNGLNGTTGMFAYRAHSKHAHVIIIGDDQFEKTTCATHGNGARKTRIVNSGRAMRNALFDKLLFVLSNSCYLSCLLYTSPSPRD